MSLFNRNKKPGAFGNDLRAGGDPSRSAPEYQGKVKEERKTVTVYKYCRCDVCSGYFVIGADILLNSQDPEPVFQEKLLNLRRLTGGLDLCLACSGAGLTKGSLNDALLKQRKEWRAKHPQKEFERLFKSQNRKQR